MGFHIIFTFCLVFANFEFFNAAETKFINKNSKVQEYAEKEWFLANIPFVELPDKNIEEVYYYRWSSHKRHLRYTAVGSGFAVTEFVNDVGYGKKFGEINAAAGHQIHESRWLRNQRYVKVNYLPKIY